MVSLLAGIDLLTGAVHALVKDRHRSRGGLRTTLQNAGLTLKITENAELFGNVTGGAQQGFSGNGLTTMQLDFDANKIGINGGFHVSGLHIWGGNLTATNLLALQTLTGIEANRLYS